MGSTFRRPLADRFWEKVHPEPNTGCWLWAGAGPGGRGNTLGFAVHVEGRERMRPFDAHRIVLEVEGLPQDIRGRCPNTALCVNPRHYRLTPPLRGEEHSQSVISDDDARLVLQWLGQGKRIQHIAAHFGISRGLVYAVLHGAEWKHLERPAGVNERAAETARRGRRIKVTREREHVRRHIRGGK